MSRPIAFKIPDKQASVMTKRINTMIHELVFAAKHIDQDEPGDASNALMLIEHMAGEILVELDRFKKEEK